jgi:hypothetical protein
MQATTQMHPNLGNRMPTAVTASDEVIGERGAQRAIGCGTSVLMKLALERGLAIIRLRDGGRERLLFRTVEIEAIARERRAQAGLGGVTTA